MATLISSYSPTNASDETEIITFYNELSSHIQHIPKQKEWSNRRRYPTDFLLENMLACLNTKFNKKGDRTMDLHLPK